MKAAVFLVLGLIVTAAGLLFALQGARDFRVRPAADGDQSTRNWVEYGIVIAAVGVGPIMWRHIPK